MSSPLPTVKFRPRSLNLNTSAAGLTSVLRVDAPAGPAPVVPAEQGGFGSAVPFVEEADAVRGAAVAHPPAVAPVRFRRAPVRTEAKEPTQAPAAEEPKTAAAPAEAVAAEPVAPANTAPKRDESADELAEEMELLSTAAKPRAKREVYSAIIGRPEAKTPAAPVAPVAAPGKGGLPENAAAAGAISGVGGAVAAGTPAPAAEPLRFNPEQWAAAARAARAPGELAAKGGFLKRAISGLMVASVFGVGGYLAYTKFVGQPPQEVTQLLDSAKAKAAAVLPEGMKPATAGTADGKANAAAQHAAAPGSGKVTPAAGAVAAGSAGGVRPVAGAVAKPATAAPAAGTAPVPAATAAATNSAGGATTATTGAAAGSGETKELKPAMTIKETIDHVVKLPFKSIEQTKKVVAMNNARVALTDAVINEETREEEPDTGPTEVPDGMSVAEFKKTAKGAAAVKKKSGVRNAAIEGVVLAKTSSLSAREIDAFDSFVMSAKISAVVPPRVIVNETLYSTGATVHHGFGIQLHAIDTENRLIVFQHTSGRMGTRRY